MPAESTPTDPAGAPTDQRGAALRWPTALASGFAPGQEAAKAGMTSEPGPGLGSKAAPAARRPRRGRVIATAVILLLLLGGGLGAVFVYGPGPTPAEASDDPGSTASPGGGGGDRNRDGEPWTWPSPASSGGSSPSSGGGNQPPGDSAPTTGAPPGGPAGGGPITTTTTPAAQNRPPNEPSNPDPANAVQNQPLSLTLRWTGGDPDGDPVRYRVLLDTSDPPLQPKCENIAVAECASGPLALNTLYFWRVEVTDGQAGLAGPVWRFRTEGNGNGQGGGCLPGISCQVNPGG